MVTDARTRLYPCPTCRAARGARCVIRGQTSEAHHAARLELARHEDAGPIAGEPAYYEDRKWRIVLTREIPGGSIVTMKLSQGARRVDFPRSRFSWDAIAGLWRVAALGEARS